MVTKKKKSKKLLPLLLLGAGALALIYFRPTEEQRRGGTTTKYIQTPYLMPEAKKTVSTTQPAPSYSISYPQFTLPEPQFTTKKEVSAPSGWVVSQQEVGGAEIITATRSVSGGAIAYFPTKEMGEQIGVSTPTEPVISKKLLGLPSPLAF